MAIEALTPAYVVSTGDFADYACFACAREFATQRGLTWNSSGYDFTVEDPELDHAYRVHSWDSHETDSPTACTCGQYLDVDLTRDGQEYALENDFPAWLLEAHNLTDNN